MLRHDDLNNGAYRITDGNYTPLAMLRIKKHKVKCFYMVKGTPVRFNFTRSRNMALAKEIIGYGAWLAGRDQ